MTFHPSGLHRDALLACLLAFALGAAWAWRDAANLAALRLPDTDDMMRLQQVRDWLGGQGWRDLAQHRLGGAGGTAMHWTRLADLGPAALIAALAPLLGRHAAEVAAVIVWPPLLFAVALLLSARIARALGGGGIAATAAVIAAIAYPATTIFVPGRIDHHGLQAVLLLGGVLAAVRPAGQGAGFALGLLAAASLVVGLETMPVFAVLGAAAIVEWTATGRRDRLAGLAVGALVGLAIGRLLFAPAAWVYPACDGFTALAWQAALPLAVLPLAFAALGTRLGSVAPRVAAATIATAAAAGVAVAVSPPCLHPYGAVDPLLVRLWLSHVGEAQPLFGVPAATALGYGGVMVAGLAATAWRWRRTRAPGWAILLASLLAALAITAMQLRGAYCGALLAAPGLAAAIRAARARGALPLVAAWTGSAGMLYPIAAEALPRPASAPATGGDCASPALLARLAALPPGRVMAPVDAGAAIVALTPQAVAAAPYHRDGAGILAAYRFYGGGAGQAPRRARATGATYVVVCAAMPGRGIAGTAATVLVAAPLPGWRTVATLADGARIDALR